MSVGVTITNIDINVDSVKPGATIDVTGRYFAPNSTVDIIVASRDGKYKKVIATVPSKEDGSIDPLSFVIPDDAPAGELYVIGIDEQGNSSNETLELKSIEFPTDCEPSLPYAHTNAVADRFAGTNRYETAVLGSKRAFPGTACTVYITSGLNFPDGLSAAPIAAVTGGPVLFSSATAINAATVEEVTRLQPKLVVIVGGVNAVGDGVIDQVKAAVPTAEVERVAGANRYSTNAAMIDLVYKGKVENAFLATGVNFPDALGVGSVAAKLGAPVVLVNGSAAAPNALATEVMTKLNPTNLYVLGGANAVSEGTYAGVSKHAGTTERLGAANRYGTSLLLNQRFFTEKSDLVMITSGLTFPDALGSGVTAYRAGAPVYLTSKTCVQPTTLADMTAKEAKYLTIFGGVGAMAESLETKTSC